VARKIEDLIKEHKRKVHKGEIITFQSNAFNVLESIDDDLREEVSKFLSSGVRALKATQKAVAQFDINIGGLFQKQTRFEACINGLENEGHESLSNFLKETRTKWLDSFIERRNLLEHENWVLPMVNYAIWAKQRVEVVEPLIDGVKVTKYVADMANLILSFVENIVVYALKITIPQYSIVEIPEEKRDPVIPKRFRLDIKRPGIQEWEIKYEENSFEKRSQKRNGLTPSISRSTQKAGRNDPCPCGSGKKYKKCCIDK